MTDICSLSADDEAVIVKWNGDNFSDGNKFLGMKANGV